MFSGRSGLSQLSSVRKNDEINNEINNDPVTILTELIQIYFLRKFIANSSGTHESIK